MAGLRKQGGQALAEYAIVLVVFVALAVAAYRAFPQALGALYRGMSVRRANIKGMAP